jgi:excisionase family DNA binding protein
MYNGRTNQTESNQKHPTERTTKMHAAQYDKKTKIWTQKVAYQQYYSVQTVCTILGVGSPSIYSAIHRGTLKAYRVGGVAHVKHEDLMQYLARRSAIPMVDRTNIEAILPRPKRAATVVDIVGNVLEAQAITPRNQEVLDLFDDDEGEAKEVPATPEAVPAS